MVFPQARVRQGRLEPAYGYGPDAVTHRVTLAQDCNRIANRIQEVLEDANIKLASVATDALGASGRQMIQAVIGGQRGGIALAEMSKGLLRNRFRN